jgi:hypothetical protein
MHHTLPNAPHPVGIANFVNGEINQADPGLETNHEHPNPRLRFLPQASPQ